MAVQRPRAVEENVLGSEGARASVAQVPHHDDGPRRTGAPARSTFSRSSGVIAAFGGRGSTPVLVRSCAGHAVPSRDDTDGACDPAVAPARPTRMRSSITHASRGCRERHMDADPRPVGAHIPARRFMDGCRQRARSGGSVPTRWTGPQEEGEEEDAQQKGVCAVVFPWHATWA